MNKLLSRAFVITVTAILFYVTSWGAFAQRPYRATDRQVTQTIATLERDSDSFRDTVSAALDNSSFNNTRTEDEVISYINDFENATDQLRRNFDARTSTSADVQDVLDRAANIDRFLGQYRLNTQVTTSFARVRTSLNTLAGYYNVRYTGSTGVGSGVGSGTGNVRPYRVSDATIQSQLNRLETDTDIFSRELQNALDRSTYNNTRTEDEIVQYVNEFENATDSLKRNFEERDSVAADVEEVVRRAAVINQFLARNRFTTTVTRTFNLVKTDLNALARSYSVTADYNQTVTPGGSTGGSTTATNRLTGTYRLDTARSTDVNAEIDRAIVGLNANQQERVRRQALRRLSAPDELAIERTGRTVTIASTTAPRVTLEADGRARTEQSANGRSVTITSTLVGDQLVINYAGDRTNDFYLAFNPINARVRNNFDDLRVTRRIYLEGVNRQITVESFYTKTSNTAELDTIFRGNNNNTGGIGSGSGSTSGEFVIANGTRLVAVLENDIDTKTAQEGDRFTMRVTSPSQYQGAIIEGRVTRSARSGRVTGRAEVGLDFDTIRYNNRSYSFASAIDSIRQADGSEVQINNEGAVREGDSQTNKTIVRTGIGAALGALIGAIAGGGEGAAIGAAVGGAAGAGSVIVQGRDDLNLRSGTEFNLTASAPRGVARQ